MFGQVAELKWGQLQRVEEVPGSCRRQGRVKRPGVGPQGVEQWLVEQAQAQEVLPREG